MSKPNSNKNKNKTLARKYNFSRRTDFKFNQLDKAIRQLTATEKAILKAKRNNNKNTPNINMAQRKRRQSRMAQSNYPAIVQEYLFAVVNPIHVMEQPRVPDFYSDKTMPMFDYYVADNGVELTIERSGVDAYQGVLFYPTYGPVAVNGEAASAWQLIIVPIDVNGLPIKDVGSSAPYYEGSANYDSIWNLLGSIRPVSYGLRVNSLIDMATVADTQFVANAYSFQMRFVDFNSWFISGTTDIATYILNLVNGYGRYNNQQGASGRFNPVQDPYMLLKFFDKDFLENNQSSNFETFNTENMLFPCIYVEFQLPMNTVSADLMQRRKHTLRKNKIIYDKKHVDTQLIQQNYVDSKIKMKSDELHRQLNDEYLIHDVISEESKEEEKKVETDGPYTFTFPLKLEARWFFEGTLLQPTPLKPTPSPSFRGWESVVFDLHNTLAYPYWSDGHSFSNILKLAKKYITPQNVVKASRYTANMISSGRQAYGNIMNAYKGGGANATGPA
jgi:hypothetical protein